MAGYRIVYPYGMPDPSRPAMWRVEYVSYSTVVDPEREIYSITKPQLEMHFYYISKKTACGVRLENGKFVNMQKTKRYAWSTPKEALDSFMMRKIKQIDILTKQLDKSKNALQAASMVNVP